MIREIVITIDGPSGAGKSTISQILAERLGYRYLDTGALYRVVALKVKRERCDPTDDAALYRLSSTLDVAFEQNNGKMVVFLEGEDVSEAIRSPDMSLLASKVSAKKVVRNALLGIQRKLGEGGGIVAEGRDMGTVVFPQAEVKFFLEASLETRGKRRYKQYLDSGKTFDLDSVTREIEKRDLDDTRRALSPLKPADDAVIIDSTNMSIEEVVGTMLTIVQHHYAPLQNK